MWEDKKFGLHQSEEVQKDTLNTQKLEALKSCTHYNLHFHCYNSPLHQHITRENHFLHWQLNVY